MRPSFAATRKVHKWSALLPWSLTHDLSPEGLDRCLALRCVCSESSMDMREIVRAFAMYQGFVLEDDSLPNMCATVVHRRRRIG